MNFLKEPRGFLKNKKKLPNPGVIFFKKNLSIPSGFKKNLNSTLKMGRAKDSRRRGKKSSWRVTKSKLSFEHRVCVTLRQVQSQSRCSTRTLNLILESLLNTFTDFTETVTGEKLDRGVTTFQKADKIIKVASGASCLRLHGCVGCNEHVYHPQDVDRTCPLCDHPRYNESGKPNELAWYFPITNKLRKLLQVPYFRKLLMYESERKKHSRYSTDVFDGPRWSRILGQSTRHLTRIAIQYCVDGVSAFAHNSLSVKPAEFMILNLPPWLRGRSKYMLLHMLFPDKLKGPGQRKYYDWSAKFEMKTLHSRGVDGVRVIVYGTSLDAPGRAEILQLKNHGGYDSCPHCHHVFEPGIFKKPCYGGARVFLPRESHWRRREVQADGHTYTFATNETRSEPSVRTTQSAAENCHLTTRSRAVRGHKALPLMSRWPSFRWDMNVAEVMHDLKNVCDMLLRIIVGKGSHGVYQHWKARYDYKHRLHCKVHNIFPEVHDENNPLPWRLTREDVKNLDRRIHNMSWPHYTDVLCRAGFSFWTKSNRMWKCAHKAMILLVRDVTYLSEC